MEEILKILFRVSRAGQKYAYQMEFSLICFEKLKASLESFSCLFCHIKQLNLTNTWKPFTVTMGSTTQGQGGTEPAVTSSLPLVGELWRPSTQSRSHLDSHLFPLTLLHFYS